MSHLLPTLTLSEWSSVTPDDTALLRHRNLDQADRSLLAELHRNSSLRIEETPLGLRVTVGPHVGTVILSQLRLVVMPKLRLDTLMAMVSYAFNVADCLLTPARSSDLTAQHGFVDLLGLTLLQAVRRLTRHGLTGRYKEQWQALSSPRGRILLDYRTLNKPSRRAYCHFSTLTSDHLLNQIVAAGLRLAGKLVHNARLGQDLIRTAYQMFPVNTLTCLTGATLATAFNSLDRRFRHYQPVLSLIAAFVQGSHLNPQGVGTLPTAGFLFDMNRLFERFITRHLQEQAPSGMVVRSQDVCKNVFTYLDNPNGWKQPTLRPDLVFLHQGKPLAIGDAKYRDHYQKPPSTEELYQLATYGLAYPLPEPREVFLFYPQQSGNPPQGARLRFAPQRHSDSIHIQLVGVPIDSIISGKQWWPAIDPSAKIGTNAHGQ